MEPRAVSPVPVLITWDVDPSPEAPLEARCASLDAAQALCEQYAVRSTFFITAGAEQARPQAVQKLCAAGHEIGCHGLTHTDEEDYDRMPADLQRRYLDQATAHLAGLSGAAPRSFRGPRVKLSGLTAALLAERGYSADSTVCSGRLDLFSSNLINTGWLTAPRLPYHPSRQNIYRRGDLPLWEVPVSAIGLPFISTVLCVFGLPFMRLLFRALYAESRRTGKPVVYLAHPVEFTAPWMRPFSWKDFSPAAIRTHGLLLRKRLYRLSPPEWLEATGRLFAYMGGFPGVSFQTVGEYAAGLENAN
ncbi:MAG: polysaccharide deacetylase family protein [Chloroflexota bacterium]